MNLLTSDNLTTGDIKDLIEQTQRVCVSMFIPTERKGWQTQQNPVRLKNMIQEAEERLVGMGLRNPEAEELLEPVAALIDDRDFWQHQSEGLAIFRSPDRFRYYRVPLSFAELLVVNNRFHVKPLLPLLSGDGRFYVLALSQSEVRLLQGTRYSVTQLDLPEDVPQSLAEALQYDEFEKESQAHAVRSGSTGARQRAAVGGQGATVFFGQGAAKDAKKNEILEYFQQIDRGLKGVLGDHRAPMVLAGVEYLLPIYREANSYKNLVDEGVEGNPDDLTAEELHDKAWAIVQPIFEQALHDDLVKYGNAAAEGRTTTGVEKVVPIAYQGRVQVLFVAKDQQQWGIYDPDMNTVTLHDQQQPGDEDLLGLAAQLTLQYAGTVYAVEQDRVPNHALVAAEFFG